MTNYLLALIAVLQAICVWQCAVVMRRNERYRDASNAWLRYMVYREWYLNNNIEEARERLRAVTAALDKGA